MKFILHRKLASYLSASLLFSLLSTGIIAPEVTTEKADAVLTQPTSSSLDLNNECDQNYISTSAGVVIEKIGNDCVIQFRAVGTYSWRVPKGLSNISRLLVVGGGGSGGLRHGGGGGAGGYVYRENYPINPHANVSIVVGNGGGRAGGAGNNGGDSLFNNTFRAKGGGGGAANTTQTGNTGGSGGGGTGSTGVGGGSNQLATENATVRGNAGARGSSDSAPLNSKFWTGGGGGGSGGAGQAGDGVNNRGGNGGAGTLNDITGDFICYAAGGGGGTNQNGVGGLGGSCLRPSDSAVITSGAQGGNNAWQASFQRDLDATPNTGSGGGGGGYNGGRSELGGAGGRGIVVIRYTLPTASLDLDAANYSGSGTSWIDSSTGKNNGTLQGAPTFVGATTDNPAHFKFDGARSQYVSTSRFIPSGGPYNFSGGVWFRTTSNQAAKIIGFENTQTGTGTGSYDRHLYIGTDNRLYWGIFDGTARTIKTTQRVNDGRWHYAFFTSTWTYGGSVISLSLDNGPAVSLAVGTSVGYGGFWRIGGYQLNGWPSARTGYYTGDIARATIYPWVLTPEQARQKYYEMYSPISINAKASTTVTGIDVSWNPIAGASYQVKLYNAQGTSLLKTFLATETSTTLTDTLIQANTGYRVSVTPIFTASSRRTITNESEKSEVVVPASANCLPAQTISGPYTILRFNTVNNQSTSCHWIAPTLTTPLEYLVIGGGGGGGQNHGAGGQGGFYNAGALESSSISGATVTITVGSGGAGARDASRDSTEAKASASPLRNGVDGSPSALVSTSRAIVASGGTGGVTTWEDQRCSSSSGVVSAWRLAKPGTPVIGKEGLAGGLGGAPRSSLANGVKNSGSIGLSALALSFNSLTDFSRGGDSGIWGTGASLGAPGNDNVGNGGFGGGSGCLGGGRGGSGTVILRYLTPLPKAASSLITLPETMNASLFARFQASDFNTITKTWKDSSGKGRDAFTTRGAPRLQAVRVGTPEANNAKNDFVAVTGSPADSIRFFALPQNYTLFHVARYNGANKNRIFDGTGSNWLSGFWAGRVGVSHHDSWKTTNALADNRNPETDWIVSTDKRNSYRSQGVDRTTRDANYQFGPLTRFGINDGDRTTQIYTTEKSDFQVAEIIIYNRELNDTEVAQVESYLQGKYTYQNPDITGNVGGGGWVPSQYCSPGQVAVGVKADKNAAGFSKFQMICQSIATGGAQTSGIDALTTKTDVGGATGSNANVYCNNASGIQTSVVTGLRLARGNALGSQDYYVAGLKLICSSLLDLKGPKTESAFFSANAQPAYDTAVSGALSYYPTPRNPANCPAGQAVIGFNAKSGSVTDAIQIICGVPPLATPTKPNLDSATVTSTKTLIASWNPVSGATSYTINVYDTSATAILQSTTGLAYLPVSETSVTITEANFPLMANATPYRITVTANGDGINTLYSPESELSDPAYTLAGASLPTWSDQPNIDNKDSVTVTISQTITIYETVNAMPGTLSYQWEKDGVPLTNKTDTDLTLTITNSDFAGQYRVTVTNEYNGTRVSATSNPFTIYVLEIFTPKAGVVSIKASETGTPYTLQIEPRGTGNKEFSLLVGGETATVNSSSGLITIPNDSKTGTVQLQVKVTMNGAETETSLFEVKFVDSALATPTGVKLSPGNDLRELKVVWDKVESATAYSLILYDSSNALIRTRGLDSVTTSTFGAFSESLTANITDSNYSGFAFGETYTVSVIAFDTTGEYADSSESVKSNSSAPAFGFEARVSILPDRELLISGTENVRLSVEVSPLTSGVLSYQWFKDGSPLVSNGNLTGVNGSVLTLLSISNSDAGQYSVEVTSVLPSETLTVLSSSKSISIVDGVKIVTPVNGLVTKQGSPFNLQLRTTAGSSPITYTVNPSYPLPAGLVLISDSALITHQLPETSLALGFYPISIVAKDLNNSYDTTTVFTISVVESQLDSATVTAVPTSVTLKSIDISWSAVANANRYLVRLYDSVTTTTSTPLAEVSGITGTSYRFTESDYVQFADNTKYKVVVVALDASGKYGDSEESIGAEVTTNIPAAAPVFTVSPAAEQTVSLGATVTLNSLASTSAGTVTYQWFKDGEEISSAAAREPNFSIASVRERDAGTYSVVATSTLNGISVSTTAETSTDVSIAFTVETPTVGLTAAVGKSYSLGIRTIGGSVSKTYTLAVGTLPLGLSLDGNTGEISGSPETTTAGTTVSVDVLSGTTNIRTTFTIKVVIPSRTKITTLNAIATPGVLKSLQVTWTKTDATVHFVHLYDTGDRLLRKFVAYDTATGTTLNITDQDFAGLLDGTEYKVGVIAVGNDTTANSEESVLQVVRTNFAPQRPTIVTQPTDEFAAIGSPVVFEVAATKGEDDTGVLSYQWFKNSTLIPGAIQATYTIAELAPGDVAIYNVRVINTLNGGTVFVTSQSARVNVLTDLEAITPTSGLKVGTGIPYRLALQSSGGAGSNTWSIVDGILPSGLQLDSMTGLISGTISESLTAGTTLTVTAQVKDRYNATDNTLPFSFLLFDSASVLATPSWTTVEATLNTTKSITLAWSQVPNATSYSIYLYTSADTPIATTGLSGLTGTSIASVTINVNNFPAIAEDTTYKVGVVANYDSALALAGSAESERRSVTTGTNIRTSGGGGGGGGGGTTTDPVDPVDPTTPAVVIPIAPAPQIIPPISIIPGAPFNLQVNVPGANNFTVNGGTLPAGLTLDPRTGLITGTPTQSGPYSFTILATPPTPGVLVTYSGTVTAPPAPTAGPTLEILPGQPFNAQVNVPGANNFTVYGGALPAGLTLDPSTGTITGTPTQSGPYDFTVLATPPATGTLVRFTGNIQAPAPTEQSVPAQTIQPGTPFNYTPNVPGANNFVIRDGQLPAGLTLDPATGRISGTPREGGPYSFSILATPPANGVLLQFSGVIEAPGSTTSTPVVNPSLSTLDPIVPTTPVIPVPNSNLLVVSSGDAGRTTVLPNQNSNGLVIISPDVTINLAGLTSGGAPIPLTAQNQLVVQAGLKVDAAGSGYLPNSEVLVYVFSTPQLVGKIKTDATGSYAAQVTIPSGLAVGNHVLQVNGFLKSNEVNSISVALLVEKAPVAKPKKKKKITSASAKKVIIPSGGVVIPFKSSITQLTAANKKLLASLQAPAGKEIYVLGYASNSGKSADILTALNRAINVSKEIKRLNPKVKVGYAGLGIKKAPQCVKLKNICAVVTVR